MSLESQEVLDVSSSVDQTRDRFANENVEMIKAHIRDRLAKSSIERVKDRLGAAGIFVFLDTLYSGIIYSPIYGFGHITEYFSIVGARLALGAIDGYKRGKLFEEKILNGTYNVHEDQSSPVDALRMVELGGLIGAGVGYFATRAIHEGTILLSSLSDNKDEVLSLANYLFRPAAYDSLVAGGILLGGILSFRIYKHFMVDKS